MIKCLMTYDNYNCLGPYAGYQITTLYQFHLIPNNVKTWNGNTLKLEVSAKLVRFIMKLDDLGSQFLPLQSSRRTCVALTVPRTIWGHKQLQSNTVLQYSCNRFMF